MSEPVVVNGVKYLRIGEEFVSTINGCARCDGDGHEDVTWKPLTHPIEDSDGGLWTHWALCPTNGEPILMRDTDTTRSTLRVATLSEPPRRSGGSHRESS